MQTQRYCESEMTAAEACGRIGSRAIAAYSSRSPDKESPNEDAAAVIVWDDRSLVLAVADGLGGASRGEAASREAIEALAATIEQADRATSQLRTAILDGIEAANREVLAIGSGAATTLAVVEIDLSESGAETARAYHVGDAGVLVCGGRGKLKLLTTAHSPVGYGVEAGLLDADEAMHHDDRHVVSNVVGATDSRTEISAMHTLAAQDTVVVASDGLFDNLSVAEIIDLARRGSAVEAADRLAAEARRRMETPTPERPSKPDDLTLLVLR